MTVPTTDDVNKAREQASQALGEAMEQARTPLLAALGAGDVAARALLDTLSKVREQADSARAELSGDPAELRKRLDTYAQSAVRVYGYLAERGEETLDRIRAAQQQACPPDDRAATSTEETADVSDDVLGTTRGGRGATSKKSQNGTGKSAKAKRSETE